MKTKRQVVEEHVLYYRQNYDAIVEKHKKDFVKGICSFEEIVYYAYLEYALFQVSKNEMCIKNSVKALAHLGRLSDEFLKEQEKKSSSVKTTTISEAIFRAGRPLGAPMDSMFRPFYYLQAYRGWKQMGVIGQEDMEYCEKAVSRSIVSITAHTDWGPQNRGLIKGINLLLAAECFEQNPDSAKWHKLGEMVTKECLGQWPIEDAQIYLPVWLNALIIYQELFGGDFLQSGQIKFYFDYIVELVTPLGVVPDFGDARFGESTEAYISCMEKGASLYGDARMKAAATLFWKFYEQEILSKITYGDKIKELVFVAQAMCWEKEAEAVPLDFASRELMEDLVCKKYRLSGQSSQGFNYLFLNYRDEGNYGLLPRHYIRNTLAVENEKTHHGHEDENAIILLMTDETVLLHDAGYRETGDGHGALPGNYRSDFFHNRMVIRRGIFHGEENLLEFFSREHAYLPVVSQKIYFETFPYCDVGRTKVIDDVRSTEYDRIILYLKREGIYLVIDSMTVRQEGDYTAAVQYFGGQIDSKDAFRYQISNQLIGMDTPEGAYHNKPGWKLELEFLNHQYPVLHERLRRSYIEEHALCQVFTGKLAEGEVLHMVSVLRPVKEEETSEINFQCRIQNGVQSADGLGLKIETEKGYYSFQSRTSLFHGTYDQQSRPTYDCESGSVRYGDIKTDALFSYLYEEKEGAGEERKACPEVKYGFVLGSYLAWKDQELFRTPDSEYIQPDLSCKVRHSYWNKWYS